FFLPDLAKALRLDGIATVVDAKHIEKELDDAPEAAAQIAFADVVLLNKTDLVVPEEVERIEARIRKINSIAKIYRTQKAHVDVSRLLNIKARELTAPLEMPAQDERDDDEHDRNHDHDEGREHYHDESVRSFCI